MNWYSYAANNPLRFTDPTGLAYEGEDYDNYYHNTSIDGGFNNRIIFDTWFSLWTDRHNLAVKDEERIRNELHAADPIAFADNMHRFLNGEKNALGQEYRSAFGKLGQTSAVMDTAVEMVNWTEDQAVLGNTELSFSDMDKMSFEIAQGKDIFRQWIVPIAFGMIAYGSAKGQQTSNQYTEEQTGTKQNSGTTNNTNNNASIEIEGTAESTQYIPNQPLKTQRVNGQDIPLPAAEAGGRPHTTLGFRLGSDGKLYRQSATFPGETWPKANGKDVPWSRVDWTDHSRSWDHANPHQHIFNYDWSKKMWFSGSQESIVP